MAVELEIVIPNAFALTLLVGLMLLVGYHTNKQKRPVRNLFISLIFGVVYGVMVIIYGCNLFNSLSIQRVIRTLYLTALILQSFYFYLFLEKSRKIEPGIFTFAIVFWLCAIQIVALWIETISLNREIPSSQTLTLIGYIGEISLNFFPIVVYGFIGIPIYYKMYQYTKEIRPLILLHAIMSAAMGYVLTLSAIILRIYNPDNPYSGLFKAVGDFLPIVGLSLLLLIYGLNISYIYRLPFDHYLLMVTHGSGMVVFSLLFETKNKQIKIEENLFSGMLTALRTVYCTVLDSKKPIQMIMNEDASILMHSGQYITATIATSQISGVLVKGLEIFVKRFEEKFGDQLINTPTDLNAYETGKDLFMQIFPFLKRKKIN